MAETTETGKRLYPKNLILNVAGLSRAAWYDKRPRKEQGVRLKTGPKTPVRDQELTTAIETYMKDTMFINEGYIKIHKHLQVQGFQVGKNRIYRLLKQAGLLIVKSHRPGARRVHDGKIITLAPNLMWATDGKEFYTIQQGKCHFIAIIDHYNDEIISFHLTTRFDAYAAMEALRMAIIKRFGGLSEGICSEVELQIRADHGTQFDSKKYQQELKFLGLKASPAFVRSPQCNGIIERFHRTLQEQVFSINTFQNIQQAQESIQQFVDNYNAHWRMHRLDLVSPIEYRLNNFPE